MAPLDAERRPARSSSSASWARASRAPLRAARAAGLEALDADELLEAELGMPIAEFFAAEGEAEFRRREEALGQRAARPAPAAGAIALGGGSVLSERVREALDGHIVVWLEADAETAWERVERPAGRWPTTASASTPCSPSAPPIYESLADAIVAGRDDAPARALAALLALRELPAGRPGWSGRRAPRASTRPTSGAACSSRAAGRSTGRRFLVTDTVVGGLYGERDRAARGSGRGRARRADEDASPRPSGCCASSPPSARPAPTTSLRSAAAWSATWRASAPPSTSAGSPWSRCRRRSSPRSTPPTAARPGSTCRRRRTTSAPTTCRPPCSPTRRPCERCRRASWRRASSRC